MWTRWLIVAFFVFWALAIWFAVGYALWRGWGPYIRSKRQSRLSVQARVQKKQGRHEFDPVNWQPEYTQKVLVFECEDGVVRDYEVHDDIWDWVEVGDDGILNYQGDLFVGFDARRPRHDVDKVYKTLTRS
jgi:hypothetical protein